MQAARIKRNSLFAFLSQFFRMVTNVVMFIIIARVYGPEEFGQFTAAHTLAIIFLFLADFGFDTLLSSEIGRNRDRAQELVQKYLSLKVLFALGATGLMLIVVSFQGVSGPTRMLMYLFSTYVLFSTLTNFFFAMFKGFEEFHHETVISLIANFLLLSAVLVLGAIEAPLWSVALVFTASRVIGLLLAWRKSTRLIAWNRFRFTLAGKTEIALMSVFGLHALFGNLFFAQDTLLLSMWRGDYDVGIYQSAFKLMAVMLVIQDVIVVSLLPVLARLHKEDENTWTRIGGLMSKTLFLLALPVAIIFFVYADQIISLVYGNKDYLDAVPVLRLFGIVILIRFSVETYALMLTTSLRQKTRLKLVIAATFVNLAFNFYAIPNWGPTGAAAVSLLTNFLVGAGYILANGDLFRRWVVNFHHAIPMLAAIVVGVILWNVRSVPLWYCALPGVALYSLIAYVGGYSESERRLVFAVGRTENPAGQG